MCAYTDLHSEGAISRLPEGQADRGKPLSLRKSPFESCPFEGRLVLKGFFEESDYAAPSGTCGS